MEKLELGPKAYFFGDDKFDFYIATKDAGFNEKTKKQNTFYTHREIKNNNNPYLNKVMADGFIVTDIMNYIFLLSDTNTNSGNTGVSSTGKFQIIDFATPQTRLMSTYKNDISDNWREKFNSKPDDYNSSIDKYLQNFKEKIEQAYADTTKSLKHVGLEEKGEKHMDLDQYCKNINENYEQLSEYLNSIKRKMRSKIKPNDFIIEKKSKKISPFEEISVKEK